MPNKFINKFPFLKSPKESTLYAYWKEDVTVVRVQLWNVAILFEHPSCVILGKVSHTKLILVPWFPHL